MTKAHYAGTYHVRARRVREEAKANPNAVCWRCGNKAIAGDPWQAGHIRDSDPTSPLAPEHRSCNARAGQRIQYHEQPLIFKNSEKWR